MTLKKWPEDPNETVSFDDLAEPLLKAIRFAYSLRRKNKDKDIPYDGFETGLKHICLSPDELLKADYLEEEDALKVIIGMALQLGIEQGRRIEAKDRNEKEYYERLLNYVPDND